MKTLLNILFIFIISAGFAQNTQSKDLTRKNKEAIEKLQKKEVTQDQSINQLQKKIGEIKGTEEKAKKVYDVAIDMMNIKDSAFNWFIGVIALIIAIFGYSLVQAKKDIKKHSEDLKKQYAKEIAKVAEREKQVVFDLLKEHQKKFSILNTSKILILNQKESGLEKKIEMLEKRFSSIEKNDIKNILDYTFYDGNNYDAVILENFSNNEKIKPWDFNNADLKEKLVNIAESVVKKDIAFLYFGPNKTDGDFKNDARLKDYLHLINFANIPSTLFSNLSNLLEFRRLMKETEEYLSSKH